MPDKPSETERTELLQLISASKNSQLAGITVLRDAAVLAVEQVQDVRLYFLENPSTVRTIEDEIFEFMVGFAISIVTKTSPVGAIVASILTSLLRTRLAFSILPKSSTGMMVASIAYQKVDPKFLKDFLNRRDVDVRKLYRNDVHALLAACRRDPVGEKLHGQTECVNDLRQLV